MKRQTIFPEYNNGKMFYYHMNIDIPAISHF